MEVVDELRSSVFLIAPFASCCLNFRCEYLCGMCQSISAKNRINDCLPVMITVAKSVLRMLYTVCIQVLGADQSVAAGEGLLNGLCQGCFIVRAKDWVL